MICKDLNLQSILEMNCLFVNDWLIFFFYVDDIMTNFHERKRESNAILWEIIDEEIRNENVKRIEMIFENKNYSKSSKLKNLTFSELVHFQNNDKTAFKKNENLKNISCRTFTNQWKDKKFRSVELATSLRLSVKNWIIEFRSNYFQIRHSLCNCETYSISEKSSFESCDDRKQSDCLFEWH
jgi:hypothetical protein